ncbi:Hemolysin-type calcium-binding repeat-containing protein [Methylomagnum ishizawai]|uniref:Hemolysin-type calcium-binding repeat-containing protein n=1 Tax=Methylomagnum ishizawai TaxID=1760988 RepID=A0A1Y6D1V7_9GAMM|nr:integrin alpha [Methylomagnum ishizawai]SMF94843.1 Hemolysin-type calcium-binding repeat-containing protein [Methylomagnum ishizawai]
MALYKFSTLANNQTLAFKPGMDILNFDNTALLAASGVFAQHGADLWITYANKTIKLVGMALGQVSSTHFSFANSGKVLVGDDMPTIANDAAANTLIGTARSDYLDGRGGADTMTGGDGSDLYVVDNTGDKVIETNPQPSQIDTVKSYISYTLPANVENLRLMGVGTLNGTGNGLANNIYANAGNNVLDGGAGNDTLSYLYAGAGVKVSLAVTTAQATRGSGSDTVRNFENLSGGIFADTLTGDSGNNILNGNGGADSLLGGAGDDTLVVPSLAFQGLDGGAGTDTLKLSGSNLTLDLTALGARLKNLEAINLNGANLLGLTPASVLGLSGTTDKLVVDGNGKSVVNAGGGWTQGADAVAKGHTYHVYTQDGATLWVDRSIAANIDGVVPLSSLNGTNGFHLNIGAYAAPTTSVSGAGDVNNDGYADLIIGPYQLNAGYPGSSSSFVVFGKASGFGASLDLSTLGGSNGLRLDGMATTHVTSGTATLVSAAGDVNGDGYADLIVGAPSSEPHGIDSGSSYVVFGKASGFTANMDLSTLDGTNGFRLDGATAYDFSGISVSAAGDVNGDGYADLIIGTSYGLRGIGTYSGSSYVVFGKASGFAANMDLSTLDGTNGFRLDGTSKVEQSGFSVNTAGDVNGDGYADLIIGAWAASPHGIVSGSSYVVFGKAAGFTASLDLSTLNGSNGFRLDGVAALDWSGFSVSAAGDINGDGFADLIIGAPGTDSSYVVFGKASGFGANMDLSTLNGGNGFRLDGNGDVNDESGFSVSAAGDVNGDGYADLIIGAWAASPPGPYLAGSSYVVFGKASGFAASVDLSTLDGSNGFRLDGAAAYASSGASVSAAGDVNGDGFADLIVSGSSSVIYGGNFTGAVTQLGSASADTLNGTRAAERFVAGQGNDTLTGGGGKDVSYGGQGNDLIKVNDLGFQKADGGSGTDTLMLTGGGQNLDLANFRNQLFDIEKIDLTGNGNNTLTFLKRDMLNLSDTGNTLQVDGNAGDHYHFSDTGWVQKANVTLVGTTYHVFDNGAAHVLLDAALTAV